MPAPVPEPLNIVEQISIAVSLAEGQFREFKSAYTGPPGKKIKRAVKDVCKDIGEALVAFANADGGELIVGVEDDGNVTGIGDFDAQELESFKVATRTHIHKDTPLQSVLVREALVREMKVLYFRVPKSTKLIHLTADGRCLRRNDLESVSVPPEQIQFDRREVISREYDRDFVDGASLGDLDLTLVKLVAEQVSQGISTDKCLQYLGLAEYDGASGLKLRRAALLLFGKSPDRWHPRCQTRILKVNGTQLGAGAAYNVSNDSTVKANVLKIIDETWDQLRTHLVETRFQEDARFKTTFIYPEVACREALVNAIAHRDYSEEGRGIEIYVYDDRIEIRNPGGLLSSISVADIRSLRGVHQSRNSYIGRTLREIGVMRELGEGMRRIFEVMKHSELAPPELSSDANSFTLTLHHRPMYAKDEVLWLEQYDRFRLTSEEKAVLLLGRKGDLIAPTDIWRRLGIVDTEHYRQIVHSLQQKGVIENAVSKQTAQSAARRKGVGVRDIPRFKVRTEKDFSSRQPSETRPTAVAGGDIAAGKSRGLYVGNIPPNTTKRDISAAFDKFGTLISIIIPRAGASTRGFAFIEFSEHEESLAALGTAVTLGNRKLVVRWQAPRSPEGPTPPERQTRPIAPYQ